MASILNATTTGGLVTSADNSGSLQLQTNNGTTAVTIDTSQRVGINTTSPVAPLDIQSDTGAAAINMRGRASGDISSVSFYNNANTTQQFYIQSRSTYSILNTTINGYMAFATNDTERMRITSGGDVSVVTAAKLGYGTGAGGTVTQATNKSTAVTLNKPTGRITTNNAALGAGATVSFSVNCNVCSATDLVLLAVTGGSSYTVQLQFVSGGVFNIRLTNTTGGSLSEAVDISYAIISGSTS